MIQCPNCGSSAQMKLLWTDHYTFSHSTERWRCGCGCDVRRVLKEQHRIITFPNGGVKYECTQEER